MEKSKLKMNKQEATHPLEKQAMDVERYGQLINLRKKMSILVFTVRKQCKLNNCIPFYPAQIRKIRKRLIFDSLVSERRGTTGLSYIQYMEIRIGEPLSSNSTNLEMPRMF